MENTHRDFGNGDISWFMQIDESKAYFDAEAQTHCICEASEQLIVK